ncbi:MAG: UDP-N-acetylmuramoyl-L-alanyl-D-glutamate--2,6-diaminopimelate ligase [Selenomonadales bacterium]|nr:UDP-N-acetylmuramoyl-L-alanyl-D-glutamate--2,6-diaminopimelate ligase [Selenomonadales bacterium]
MAKLLSQLLGSVDTVSVAGSTDIEIQDVSYDSRTVTAGTLFICLDGARVDGHAFAQKAAEAGAVAIIAEKEIEVPAGITVVRVNDTRAAMQEIVPRFFDYPSRKLRMIGVTGTNGKTTSTYVLRSILKKAGYRVGVIGTIQIMIEDEIVPINNTTPDVIDLQKILARMVDKGIDYVIMEVSSHALVLNRVAGCDFNVAMFTNLTQDHLDFHKTLEQYMMAKADLFTRLADEKNCKPNRAAVVNLDDSAAFAMLAAAYGVKRITYGIREEADVRATDIRVTGTGTSFKITGAYGEHQLNLRITGIFNVYNVLGTICAALSENISWETIIDSLESFTSVAGRFELIDGGQSFPIIVDYAHTPDGLENILKTAKEFAQGRIIVVFGCGGDRDRTKRPIMGRIAAQLGDVVIATSDNPRTEDPDRILEDVEAGILEVLDDNTHYEKIADRRKAIERAITMAKADDVVMIAGKGHETYQILNTGTIHFDDREVAREVARGLTK